MHLISIGVSINAPSYLLREHAVKVVAQALADSKEVAQGRLKLGAIDDQAVMLNFSTFEVDAAAPDTVALNWLLAHPHMEVRGDDRRGWTVDDLSSGGQMSYAAGRTAREAIAAAIQREQGA